MNLIPHGAWSVGRLVDVRQSVNLKLELPDAEKRNVTVMAIIDAVGPDVKRVKPGDLVIYFHSQHIVLRNGMHAVLISDDEIMATVQCPEAELPMLKIEPASFGKHRIVLNDEPPAVTQ